MFDLYTNRNLSTFQAETLEEVVKKYVDFYTIGSGSDDDIAEITKITFGDDAKEIDFDCGKIQERIEERRHAALRESLILTNNV